jgi:hypothetical protein
MAVIDSARPALRWQADRLEQLAESTPDRVAPSSRDASREQNVLREHAARADQRARTAELVVRRVPRR